MLRAAVAAADAMTRKADASAYAVRPSNQQTVRTRHLRLPRALMFTTIIEIWLRERISMMEPLCDGNLRARHFRVSLASISSRYRPGV